MDRRNSLGLLGITGGALLLGLLSTAACSAPVVDEPSKGAASSVTERPFDRNAVLDDKSMRDAETLTVADVQKFLDKTPWGTRSALAKYTEGGKSAATIMVDAAKAHGINPLEMLVRVQMEQGLVYKTTAPATSISLAFGCGCPHSSVCNDSYRGFANQAECAAGTMRRTMDKALTASGTVSGWSRGKSKDTEDGLTIVPKNAVTAALYTYTPWVGEAGGGKKGVGGVSLHAQVWDRFAESVSYGAWATSSASSVESAGNDAGTADSATADPVEDPAPVDPDPTPAADAGTTTPEADAGTDNADAGPTGDGTTPSTNTKGPAEDGSDDGAIIGEGSTPPSSNAPPARKTTPSKPEELPSASDGELAGKSKSASGGCSTTGHEGGPPDGLLIASAAALAIVTSRRRRTT
jgi:MYXO-CTERM domain-containing protein